MDLFFAIFHKLDPLTKIIVFACMKSTNYENYFNQALLEFNHSPNQDLLERLIKDFGSKDAAQEQYLQIRTKEIQEDEERKERERKAIEENDWIVI